MATTLKILEDFYEESFTLTAIHSDLEDYALAYAINAALKVRLERSNKDLDFSDQTLFPYFEWKDEFSERYWTLIVNQSEAETDNNFDGLFSNEPSYTKRQLVPEYKEVDYFLKVDQEDPEEDELILKTLQSVPKVIMAYNINTDKLKSKQNLIF